VVTPEIPDLLNFQLTGRVTDTIEDAALWIVKRHDLFGSSPVAMLGVSFSGGLSIVAAGRPSLRDRVAYVLSFGGHGNLPRVLRFLCTGIEPALSGDSGRARRPNNYALTVMLHQAADLVVPAEQSGVLREGIEIFLRASALDRFDKTQADRTFVEARALQMRMPEPSANLMAYVNDRNVAALGRALLPYLDRLGQDPSLSPDRSAAPSAHVYLLHGSDDNVIPAVETERLAQHLEKATKVRTLISGFLTHVDVATRPTVQDTWRMIAFWKAVLGEN
jgi:dienelactone hydrolase